MRTELKRRWHHPLAAWRPLVLAATFAGAGAMAIDNVDIAGAGAASSSQNWVAYFYPLKVGWTCHESLNSGGITGSETLTIAAVSSVRGGRSVTVDEASSTTVNGTTVPTNVAAHYILTNSGGLVSIPSSGQVAGQSFQVLGNTTYPSVHALFSGGTTRSTLHINAPLNSTDSSEFKGVLTPGSTSLHMTATIEQSGTPAGTLRTPGGTFRNALAVHSKLDTISITNASKSASKELNSVLKPIVAKELAVTTWYAPGHGPVKFSLSGVTAYITNCSQGPVPASGGSTGTTGSTGNSGGSSA